MTISTSANARAVAVETKYKDNSGGTAKLLKQRIAVFADMTTGTVIDHIRKRFYDAASVGAAYGYGSPAHLIALQIWPTLGGGVSSEIAVTFYPTAGGTTASAGSITPAADQTKAVAYQVDVNGIKSKQFSVAVGATVAAFVAAMVTAINAVPEMPVVASDGTTKVDITAKWKGKNGDGLKLAVDYTNSGSSAFTIVQPTGGAGYPTITTQLLEMGTTWETMVINSYGEDTTILDAFYNAGEARWADLVKTPFVAFSATKEDDVTVATTTPILRKAYDRVNIKIAAPDSKTIPFVIAAKAVAEFANRAHEEPAWDYARLQLTGVSAGANSKQWAKGSAKAETAVSGGVSTTEVVDGVVRTMDTVTYYAPTGVAFPGFKYLSDIIKVMNVLYNVGLIFDSAEWDGAPLLSDSTPTTNAGAKKPKDAVTAVNNMIDALANQAILTNPDAAKKLTTATIDAPKFLSVNLNVQISGTANIFNIGLNFGFNFGGE